MPEIPANLKPTLCLKRDKEALGFCLSSLCVLEPCSVLEINGFGVKIIYFELIERLKKVHKGRVLKSINAQNAGELRKFLKEIKDETRPLTAVIYLSTNEDCSWFLQELDDLRDTRGTDFVTAIFAQIGEVFKALTDKQKILCRSLRILPPINFEDMLTLINDFQKRFSYIPSKKQIADIYHLSGGHVGLIKSLYLNLRSENDLKLDEVALYRLPSISSRLDEIIKLLPTELLNGLFNYPKVSKYNFILESFYFVKSGKVFSPLFHKYLEKEFLLAENGFSENDLIRKLSKNEMELIDYLRNNICKVVSREDLARVWWNNDWEDKYSDWAIDQIIYRLRRKIKKVGIPYKILTKKGQGFILQDK